MEYDGDEGDDRLTVAVRLAFCRGTTWLGVMGTAGNFIGGGVAGPRDTLQEDVSLLDE